MTNTKKPADPADHSDGVVERRISESVNVFKQVVENKFNRLSEANRRLKQKIFDLYTIFELSRKLNSMLDLEDLLSEMLSTLMEQLGIRSMAIFLRKNPKDDRLSFFKLKGIPLESPTKTRHWEISLRGELYRLFLSEKESLFLEEIQAFIKDDSPELRILEELDCRLCVPLISRDELVGILVLGSKNRSLRFTDSDLEFIFVLADHLTVALENAVLYESQKSINEELKRTQRQLIRSEKLAALGQLSASLAHEINNPLGIIKNYLLILSETLEAGNSDRASFKIIKDEVDRIARIVKSLLDFSRPGKDDVSPLDLSATLKETIALVNRQFLRKKITIELRLPENLPRIQGSEDQLKQVFLNLLINSKDSMPEGGDITISAQDTDEAVQIEFSDTGCGIAQENMPRIFDPFFSTKPGGKGTGLGLWICYGIMERHGGAVQAVRKEKGISFVLTFPKTES
jgi:signal transduction histidine kinase